MPIFKVENNKVKQSKTAQFKNEKELQTLIENNLEEIFGIKFIFTELSTGEKHGGRIDTLGLDENNNPVIVEYKWGEKDNIINQGLFYLDWLVDHKGDFQILVEKKLGKRVKIEWGQPRLILVANSFSKYDKHAIKRMAENIELWIYTLYENGIFEVNIEGSSQASDKKGKRITKIEYAKYDLNYHLNRTAQELQHKFNKIREKILEWENVREKTEQKSGVTYKTTKSFIRFEFGKDYINALIRNSKYGHTIDPKGMVKDITSFEWGYKGLIKITKETDIDYLLDLIRQSYEETL